ncbi:MAG: hypothetical protein IPI04_04555 [Ignavibacteria bacterium]|nr:hypothetical protein [Ignavibacteria bacterium]MBK7253197.1 hypothetical protein [Ignavibacteria bacterium]
MKSFFAKINLQVYICNSSFKIIAGDKSVCADYYLKGIPVWQAINF